jgi:hypothetical protein
MKPINPKLFILFLAVQFMPKVSQDVHKARSYKTRGQCAQCGERIAPYELRLPAARGWYGSICMTCADKGVPVRPLSDN